MNSVKDSLRKLSVPKDQLLGMIQMMYGIDPTIQLADPTFDEIDSSIQERIEAYLNNCDIYHVQPDSSILISLMTGWNVIKPSKNFKEGHLLPLSNVLCDDENVTHLDLSHTCTSGNGDSNMRILRGILSKNSTITHLDLSKCNVSDYGVAELSLGLKNNSSLKSLNLSENYFGSTGCRLLGEGLAENESIKEVDLSMNALGFTSIHSLLNHKGCCGRIKFKVAGNFVFEEIMNSITHLIAFIFGILGTIVLLSEVAGKSDHHFWACIIFCVSLLVLFLSSTLYHSFFMLPKASKILQVADHCGIYLLIAGSYTPFMLISLHHLPAATIICCVEWITAVLGVAFSMAMDHSKGGVNFLELAVFLSMGMAVFFVFDEFKSSVAPEELQLLAAGGASYVIGIIFFVMGEMKPIFHVVWHLFVMAGALLHFLAIYLFTIENHVPIRVK